MDVIAASEFTVALVELRARLCDRHTRAYWQLNIDGKITRSVLRSTALGLSACLNVDVYLSLVDSFANTLFRH